MLVLSNNMCKKNIYVHIAGAGIKFRLWVKPGLEAWPVVDQRNPQHRHGFDSVLKFLLQCCDGSPVPRGYGIGCLSRISRGLRDNGLGGRTMSCGDFKMAGMGLLTFNVCLQFEYQGWVPRGHGIAEARTGYSTGLNTGLIAQLGFNHRIGGERHLRAGAL